jgi:hypothetical protein
VKRRLLSAVVVIALAAAIAGVLADQSTSFHQNLTFPIPSSFSVTIYVYTSNGTMSPISNGEDLSPYWQLVPPQPNIGYSYTLPIAVQNNGNTNANVTLTFYNLNTTIWNPSSDAPLNPDGSFTLLAGQLLSIHLTIHENQGYNYTQTGDFTIGESAIQTP